MAEEKELGLSPSVTQAEIDECYERYARQFELCRVLQCKALTVNILNYVTLCCLKQYG